MDSVFSYALCTKLIKFARLRTRNNYDSLRFGPRHRAWRQRLHSLLLDTRLSAGATDLGQAEADSVEAQLQAIWSLEDRFSLAYNRLCDEGSREWLLNLLAYRVWGLGRVRLPRNTPEYWKLRKLVPSLLDRNEVRSLHSCGFDLKLYELSRVGFNMRLYCHPLSVLNTFLLQQYVLKRDDTVVRASADATVIDGGACWGDTTLFFAQQVGSGGRVVAVECDPDNLEVFGKNLSANAELARTITPVRAALWSKPGEPLAMARAGPATTVAASRHAGPTASDLLSATSTTIDEVVRDTGIESVDFIKLDIEGAEKEALLGASNTIRRSRPALAIAAYHRLDDIPSLIETVDCMNLGYRFFLDHYTIHLEETVLFAVAESESHAS